MGIIDSVGYGVNIRGAALYETPIELSRVPVANSLPSIHGVTWENLDDSEDRYSTAFAREIGEGVYIVTERDPSKETRRSRVNVATRTIEVLK